MSNTIQVKRGANASLPTLNAGEFGFSTDTHQIYIGDGAANHELLTDEKISNTVYGTTWSGLTTIAPSKKAVYDEMETKATTSHLHDERYYIESEVDTISGSLNTDIEAIADIINYADSPMVVTGGAITLGTNAGTFKVAALTALLRTTDSDIGILEYVTKTEEDNIAVTLADTLYYIVLNYNSGSPTISLITDLQDFTNNIPLGSVMRNGSNQVYYISGCYRLQDGIAKLHYRSFELYGLYLTSGNTIAYSGTNNFTMIAGVIYEGINRLTQSAYDSAVTAFEYIYQDGSSGWTTVSGNAIDYTHYDDGDGTLGDLSPNKFGCHWVYRHVADGDVYVVYGRDNYATVAEAEAAQIPTVPDHLLNFGCLIGRIIAPQAGGSFSSIQMVTDTVLTSTPVTIHNDLGGLNANDYKHLTAAEYSSAVLDRASPGNIGGTTPGSGEFTTLKASTDPTDEHGVGDRSFNDGRYYLESEVNTISGSLQTNISGKVSNTVYGTPWSGVTDIAPSKNAVYDEMETKADKGANSDITSMTGLDNDGIPLAKVANAISDATFTEDGGVIVGTGAGTYQEESGETLRQSVGAAISGANNDITSMVALNDDGIPLAKVSGALGNMVEDTTPQLGGQLEVQEFDIKLDSLLSVDGKYSGLTCDGVLGATLAFGDLVYLNTTDQRWELADADAEATAGDVQLAIVLVAGNDGDTKLLLLQGFVREDDWNFTSYGQSLFVGLTAGDMVQSVATYTTGDIVRVVGYASTFADQIYFNPSGSWVEIT